MTSNASFATTTTVTWHTDFVKFRYVVYAGVWSLKVDPLPTKKVLFSLIIMDALRLLKFLGREDNILFG